MHYPLRGGKNWVWGSDILSFYPGPANSQLWDCRQVTQPLWVPMAQALDLGCSDLSSDSAKNKKVCLGKLLVP